MISYLPYMISWYIHHDWYHILFQYICAAGANSSSSTSYMIEKVAADAFDKLNAIKKLVSTIIMISPYAYEAAYRQYAYRHKNHAENLKTSPSRLKDDLLLKKLQPVHAEQVPETPPQPHLPICKSEVLVHRAKLIDLCNHNVYTAVVEVQAPILLPLKVIVCHCRCLQYGK